MTTSILGLDISSHMGVVAHVWTDSPRPTVPVATEVHIAPKQLHPVYRIRAYADALKSILIGMEAAGHPATFAVIENFAFSLSQSLDTTILQVSIAHTIKEMLLESDIPYILVTPGQVKKFTTGKGNVKKDKMLLEVYKRWGFEAETDNVADAYAMAAFGGALIGKFPGMPKPNMEAVAQAKNNRLSENKDSMPYVLQSVAKNC